MSGKWVERMKKNSEKIYTSTEEVVQFDDTKILLRYDSSLTGGGQVYSCLVSKKGCLETLEECFEGEYVEDMIGKAVVKVLNKKIDDTKINIVSKVIEQRIDDRRKGK